MRRSSKSPRKKQIPNHKLKTRLIVLRDVFECLVFGLLVSQLALAITIGIGGTSGCAGRTRSCRQSAGIRRTPNASRFAFLAAAFRPQTTPRWACWTLRRGDDRQIAV